jgi:hypothetical protein
MKKCYYHSSDVPQRDTQVELYQNGELAEMIEIAKAS